MGEFKVFHLRTGENLKLELPFGYWALQTCLRSLVITEAQGVPPGLQGHEFKQGEGAYEFLLKVICGLDSPLLGETEILGQFKGFFKKFEGEFSPPLRESLQQLQRDGRMIRSQYLQNLGGHSYGSLLRKELRGRQEPITLLGAGVLAQKLLPWLAKGQHLVWMYTRHPENHRDLSAQYPQLRLRGLRESHQEFGVLVVAAPLTVSELESLWDLSRFSKIYDLRGDSQRDQLLVPGQVQVITLESLFSSLQRNQAQALEVRKKVLAVIKEQTQAVKLLERPYPFGWEDLWISS